MGKQTKKQKGKTTNQPPLEPEATRESKKGCARTTPERMKGNREEMNKGADIAVDTMMIESVDDDGMEEDAAQTLEALHQFKKAKTGKAGTRTGKTRLCGSLTDYQKHVESIEVRTGAWKCNWCGEDCYSRCSICGVAAHNNPKAGLHKGKNCFLHLHNDDCYGLAKCDSAVKGIPKRLWTEPSPEAVKLNQQYIEDIKKEHPYRLRNRHSGV